MDEPTNARAARPSRRVWLGLSMLASALLAGAGALILTDAGQLLSVGKPVVLGYFRVHRVVMIAAAVLLGVALWLNGRWGLVRTRWMAAFGVFVVGCLLVTKFVTPYLMFPSLHHGATYGALDEAELEPSDPVYVVELNGVARAFPKHVIWQPHIFGADFAGEDVVFTYCVLTNLPMPFRNELRGEPMDLRVLAQTNNNLLAWDTNSGEIIQQITASCELSGERLEPLPVLELSWRSYRELYPEGTVLLKRSERPLERLMDALMPIEEAHAGERWMFPTVALDDDRLPSKEPVLGLVDGDHAVAYTRDAVRRERVVNVQIGSRRLVLAHVPEHDAFVAFDRRRNGEELSVTEVDVFGNTPDQGRLERAFVYNGPMWAVWVHYFPHTELVK